MNELIMAGSGSPPGVLRKLPPKLLKPLRFAPKGVQRSVLEFALRQFFQEAMTAGELAILEGRWIRLEIADAELSWLIGVVNNTPVVSMEERVSDLVIRGNLEEFVLLASDREDPDAQFFQRRLVVEGDTELGLEVKNLIYSLDPERLPMLVNLVLNQLGWLVEKTKSKGL
jgi:predicted lipid carrier protein YhbT